MFPASVLFTSKRQITTPHISVGYLQNFAVLQILNIFKTNKNISVRDLWHFGTDPDADAAPDANPALYVRDLQDTNNKYLFTLSFYAYSFLTVHLNHSSKIKSHKSQNSRIKGFS